MSNILEYKGYTAKIECSVEDNVLFGKIDDITDLVNFESADMEGIVQEFHSAVDDYIDFCKEVGKEPNKPFKGLFQVRTNPNTHKKLALIARIEGKTLNAVVDDAIKFYINHRNNSIPEPPATASSSNFRFDTSYISSASASVDLSKITNLPDRKFPIMEGAQC